MTSVRWRLVSPAPPRDRGSMLRTIVAAAVIITAVDGHAITTMEELSGALIAHKPGDDATLSVYRDGSRRQIASTLGDRPTTPGGPQTTPTLP